MHPLPKNTLISLYDAVLDMVQFIHPELAVSAQELGRTLGKLSLGVITRAGSPLSGAALAAVHDEGGTAIMLSPAGSEIEHTRSFRLPRAAMPVVYTGRGALGADVVALSSSRAIIILGSDDEALEGILGCSDGHGLPIGILTTASDHTVRQAIGVRYPQLLQYVYISADPQAIVKHIVGELRRRHLAAKI